MLHIPQIFSKYYRGKWGPDYTNLLPYNVSHGEMQGYCRAQQSKFDKVSVFIIKRQQIAYWYMCTKSIIPHLIKHYYENLIKCDV